MALISNPNNPVSPQGVIAIAIVFTVIVWILASIRFWALRKYSYKPFTPRWISNLSIILIVVFVTVSLGLLLYAYHLVFVMLDLENKWISLENERGREGVSEDDITMKQYAVEDDIMDLGLLTMKSSLAWRIFSTTSLWLVKFSIVMVYIELKDTVTQRMRWLMFSTLFVIITTYVAITTLFCVGMPSENWGQNKTSNLPIITEYLYGAANIFTDLQILVIALWSLLAIKLPQSKLYAITILLFMGFVTIGLAIARAILYDVHIRTVEPLHQSVDLIGLIEPLIASWLACLPALRVLFRSRKESKVEELEARLRELRSSGHERINSRNSLGSRPDEDLSEIARVGFGSIVDGFDNYRCQHPTLSDVVSDTEENDDHTRARGYSERIRSYALSDGTTQVGDESQPPTRPQSGVDTDSLRFAMGRCHSRSLTFDSTSPLSPSALVTTPTSATEKRKSSKPSKRRDKSPDSSNFGHSKSSMTLSTLAGRNEDAPPQQERKASVADETSIHKEKRSSFNPNSPRNNPPRISLYLPSDSPNSPFTL
ncbi:hypothetical protein DFH27DRAFT_615043 [Peziza echinospora]|nr:hypothetical protein DFH27DRAFT_615043 [Peziza echinospora]